MRIGVFDSGIGGLTVLAALRRVMPSHRFLYLGDTARVPYGTRSPQTVIRYACRVASYLYAQRVDAMVVACNTATAHALPQLSQIGDRLGVPVFGVIEPGVEAALAGHQGGRVAVLGTEGTIRGGAYQAALRAQAPDLAVEAVACPLFVPLAEEGWVSGSVAHMVAETYLADLRGRVGTVILGCTHYPLLTSTIQQVLPEALLVDSATATADAVRRLLGPGGGGNPEVQYRVTDHVERFVSVGTRFLGHAPQPVEGVDIGPAEGPFADLQD